MEVIKLREKLIYEISTGDDELLKVVEDAIDSYNYLHTTIVSEPLTIEQYNKEIELAENDITNGDVFTQEEVEAIVKRWRRE